MQALAREYSVPTLRRIIAIMESPATEDDTALRAANLIIERGYGKAPQKVEAEHYDVMTEAELDRRINDALAGFRSLGVAVPVGAGPKKAPKLAH